MKARLSDHYRRELSEAEASLARKVIGYLHASCTDKPVCCADGVGPVKGLRVEHGARLTANGTAVNVSPTVKNGYTPSVNDAICEAVRTGVIAPSGARGVNVHMSGAGNGSGGSGSTATPKRKAKSTPKKSARKSEPKSASMKSRAGAQAQVAGTTGTGLRMLRKIADAFDEQTRKAKAAGDPEPENQSGRMLKDGAAMRAAGLPWEAVLHALALGWSQSDKDRFDITEFDPCAWGERVPGQHGALAYLERLHAARVPAYLIGPAGSGKGYLAHALAERLGVDYASISCNGGISPAWLLGRDTVSNGVTYGDFVRIFRDGGVFVFDEIDAASPDILILVNEAIANGRLYHPLTGECIVRHADFYAIGIGNTLGTGATAAYSSRRPIDGATLDRFRMGRVHIGHDRDLQVAVAYEILRAAGVEDEYGAGVAAEVLS